ncbi:MAG: hypothetical protein COB66_03320 [Coxiella sp. (in: Bacteria)]|nr:MAG: hypothetical protein COB66_03320 [Coxiella sp. (in: g-proteobacteria)]
MGRKEEKSNQEITKIKSVEDADRLLQVIKLSCYKQLETTDIDPRKRPYVKANRWVDVQKNLQMAVTMVVRNEKSSRAWALGISNLALTIYRVSDYIVLRCEEKMDRTFMLLRAYRHIESNDWALIKLLPDHAHFTMINCTSFYSERRDDVSQESDRAVILAP